MWATKSASSNETKRNMNTKNETAWVEVQTHIREQSTEARFTPQDARLIWALGVEAYKATRAKGGTFPTDVQVRLMASGEANSKKEETVCH